MCGTGALFSALFPWEGPWAGRPETMLQSLGALRGPPFLRQGIEDP